MPIVEIDDRLSDSYETFVRGQPEALFYASSGYRRLLRTLLGAQDRYLACLTGGGEIEAAMPLFISRPGTLGPILNSLPFYGSNGGILGARAGTAARRALMDAYERVAHEAGCAAATLVSSPMDAPEVVAAYRSDLLHDMCDSRIGQVTQLPGCCEAMPEFVEKRCRPSVKSALAKARRSGVTVVANDREGMHVLKTLHVENMNALSGLAKPAEFFDLVSELFTAPHDYRVYTAIHDGEPVAALLLFYFNQTVEYYVPAIRNSARTHQPLGAILYQAMSDAIVRGCTRWNWGGTWATQDGVYAFKRRWAAEDRPYFYFTRIFNSSLQEHTKAEILAAYPYFYVLPFDTLATQSA